jgi:TetR/AcrR family transcriptional regulator, cholesterol catabolism regulator
MKNPAGSTKDDKYRRRHSEIIDAAATVFARKGYHGASTKDVADRLGIRQGSIYYYVPSKEAALEEVCLIGVEGFIQRLTAVRDGPGTPAEKVRAAIVSHLEPTRDLHNYVRTFLSSRRYLPPTARRNISRLSRAYERMFEQLVREGVASGEFRPDLDCRLATLGIMGMCNAAVTWYGVEEGATIERIAAEYGDMVLNGLKQR